MASLTKVLGATMIALRAVEAGDLTLYDTLGMHFPDAPEEKKGITIKQIMSHSAGFAPHFYLSEETDDPADALNVLLNHPLEYAPGEDVRYSCMGYITLGRLLEKLYGQPLDKLAQERVFALLGMKNTGYCPAGGNIAATEISAGSQPATWAKEMSLRQ